jgi:allantoicase
LHRLNPPLTCHIFGLTEAVSKNANIDELMAQAPRWKIRFSGGEEVIPADFQQYMLEQNYLNEAVADVTRFQIMLDLAEDSPWSAVVPFGPLAADKWHRFTQFENNGPFTHLLYTHYPNGGVHALKLFGIEQ